MAILLIVCEPFTIKFLIVLPAVNAYVTVPVVSSKLKLMAFASVKAPAEIVLVTPVPPPIHSTSGVPLIVRLVIVEVFQTVDVVALVVTILPVPKFIVLATAPEEANNPVDNVNEPNARVPAVSVVVIVLAKVKLSCSVHEPPVPLNVQGLLFVIPPDVIVFAVVAVNVTAPVIDHTVSAIVDQFPATVRVGVVPCAKVTVPAETVRLRQANAPVIVTVYVLA